MWFRRAVRLPWNVLGAVTALSITAVVFPIKALSGVFAKPTSHKSRNRAGQRTLMSEVYDAREVTVMLKMVQAAMQYKTHELDKERLSSSGLQQQIEDLQESLETVNYLFAQEQQHRLGLQADLEAAETAAADLRQMLSLFFGDSPASSPETASDPGRYRASALDHEASWRLASATSPNHLHSGLPGTLDRRDSRLQTDLAGIQKRLHKIAQLRDTPPSSPRSSERISAWSSPSHSDPASPNADLHRSRTVGSRMLKMSPLRTATMSPSVQHDESNGHGHARFADNEEDLGQSIAARLESCTSSTPAAQPTGQEILASNVDQPVSASVSHQPNDAVSTGGDSSRTS